MYIYTFNNEIADKLQSHGGKLIKEVKDINGKRVWCISTPDSFTFDINSLPKDQVVIQGNMRIDF